MENVIKQGYLKRGNSTEGGRFSGIFDKMALRKWYMLVVRSRVPFLEQYDRDVDVFSSPPTASYDLRVCTSISRTMATTAKTFSFVIVCPTELIEFVASSRDVMRDWCDILERTLTSLGVLKKDTNEHIYSFCPAVSNLVGHSQEPRDEDDADQALGAVGGAPPPTPPPRLSQPPAPQSAQPPPLPGNHPAPQSAQPPPLPGNHPAPQSAQPPPLPGNHPSLSRANSDSGGATALCPPPTSSLLTPLIVAPPRQLTRGGAASSSRSRSPNSPLPASPASTGKHPASPCAEKPLPESPPPAFRAPPVPAQPSLSTSSEPPPPPLPPGRPGASPITTGKPPPRPPFPSSSSSSSHQNRSLPPVPVPVACLSDAVTVPPKKKEDQSDGATVLPTKKEDEVTVLPQKQEDQSDGATVLPTKKEDQSDEGESESDYTGSDFVSGAFWEINRKIPVPNARHAVLPSAELETDGGTEACNFGADELDDDGYSDLRSLTTLKTTPDSAESPRPKVDADGYSQVNKNKKNGVVSEEQGNITENAGRSDSAGGVPGLEEAVVCGTETESESSEQTVEATAVEDAETTTRTAAAATTDAGQVPAQQEENFYAPFPGQQGDASPASLLGGQPGDDYDDITEMKSAARQKNSAAAFASEKGEGEDLYASAAEASSLPTSGVPPLPPRHDSLPSLPGDRPGSPASPNNNAAAASNGSSVSAASPAEAAPFRPTPARRKTIQPISAAPILRTKRDTAVGHNPPLPPRRSTIINRVQSVDSALRPPPLPARKTQSVRRPSSENSDPVSHQGAESLGLDGGGGKGEATGLTASSASVRRQSSLGGGDGAENHLRQRMRLDREHSGHSVVSLKQSQADILRQEMDLPGVIISVSLRAAQGVAVVDCADSVCVVGWNQRDFPSLHGKFHVGDQLISITNIKVTSAAIALKMLKHPPSDSVAVEMLVRRTPHAKVMAIRRAAEGQNIGIKRNGGTAEILYVDPHGLAAQNGLDLHAPTVLSEAGRCHWVLTEINSRHLSLFFKDNEIEHRLNAVGREITIVVQPSDYISELKKQMKKLKSHKNYIVQ